MEGNNRRLPLWLLVLLQLALAGMLLCVFSLFHHVIPYHQRRQGGMPEPIAAVTRTETPAPTDAPIPTELSAAPEKVLSRLFPPTVIRACAGSGGYFSA